MPGQGLSCLVEGGLWKVKLRNGSSLLTHGPDEVAAATGSTVAAAPARNPLCTSLNPNGGYSQVAIIAWPSDVTPNESDVSLRGRLAAANGLLHEDAVASGSPGGADYVYACDGAGQVRVDRVRLPTPASSTVFTTIVSDLQALGYNKANEKYVVWFDHNAGGYCGQASLTHDEADSAANRNNRGPDYAVAYDCDSLMHENAHNLGAVQFNAPYSNGYTGHCWQEYDVMCYAEGGGSKYPGSLTYTCGDRNHFDCGSNDYFDAKIGAGTGGGAGSYLDVKWNLGECYVRFIVNHSCWAGTTGDPDAYRADVLGSAPRAYWRLGEGAGVVAVDESGAGRHAAYVNGVALGQAGAILGEANTAVSLDGVNDRIAAPSVAINSGAFTLEAWALLRGAGSTGESGYATVFGYDWSHRVLWRVSDGKLLTQFDGNFFSSVSASLNVWHHVVYSFDGSTERFFIDGVAAGSHATTRPVWSQPFRVGDYDGTNYLFRGSVDEVAVYGRALPLAEVQAHYTASGRTVVAPPGGNYRGVVLAHTPRAYWRLGETVGSTAVDESGGGKAGTYGNGPALGAGGALVGDPNTAVSLDGANDLVAVSSPVLTTGPFTLELWAYLRGPGTTGETGYATLFGYDWSHRILWRVSDGKLLTQFDGNFFSTVNASLNAWHHLVYVFDGGTERFYVDGTAAGSHATTRPVWNKAFRLGDYDGTNYLFRGSLDEVAVYARALTQAEVQGHFSAG